jgi:prepilin-type N-terminal cleavage/methylation domain-containing protein
MRLSSFGDRITKMTRSAPHQNNGQRTTDNGQIQRTTDNGHTKAFTLIELLIVIGIIALLLGILLPAAEHVRHQAYIDKCASNLHQIGIAITMYEQDNHGNFPRTVYDPTAPLTTGTGVYANDPFTTGGPAANDLTAGLFLLMKTAKLPPIMFICPYNDDTEYVADSADLTGRSNFTHAKLNLAYSFANPYPNDAAVAAGYTLSSKMGAEFALAADMNPGVDYRSNVFSATPTASKAVLETANSDNHEKDGQNVLYGDDHVDWTKTPLCGMQHDNIYTSQSATTPTVNASPAGPTDSVLLPDDD